jgi:cytochrome c
MNLRLMVLAFMPVMAAPVWAQNAGKEEGRVGFNNACRTCHTIKEGDNRLGPSLHPIIGKKAGTVAGYNNYSSSMKDAGLRGTSKHSIASSRARTTWCGATT